MPGDYQIIVRNNNGCEAGIQLSIDIDTTAPVISVSDAVLTCDEPMVDVIGSHDAGIDVTWSLPGGQVISNTNTFQATRAGKYIFTAADPENGCVSSRSITVEDLRDLPIPELVVTQPDCDVDLGSINVGRITGGSGNYSYSTDGVNYSSVRAFADLTPGTYILWTKDDNGCIAVDTVIIQEIIRLDASLSAEIEIELGDQIKLDLQIIPDPGAVSQIRWTPSEGLSCTDCPDPIASPLESRRYQVEITDTNGCIIIREIFIKVKAQKVYIPNVFTPKNGDGLNDRFVPFTSRPDNIKVNYLRVYSRWGELIYEGVNFHPNDLNEGWDGTFRGRSVNPGVYVYSMEIEFPDGQRSLYSGDVTIMD